MNNINGKFSISFTDTGMELQLNVDSVHIQNLFNMMVSSEPEKPKTINNESILETPSLPDVLKPADVQEFLKLGRTKTYELLKQKPFPVLLIGNSLRIPRDSFLAWLKETRNVHL